MNGQRLNCKTLLIAILAATSAAASDSSLKPQVKISCPLGIPVILKQVSPIYPSAASALGIQGKVKINFRINKNGIPENLRVASGPPSLIGASLVAIRQWRYKPFVLNGQAVAIDTWATINYKILQTPKANPKHDAQKCAPKVANQGVVPEEQILFATGEKFTGISPVVTYKILDSGEPTKIQLKRSSGIASLDKQAIEWVKVIRYNSRPGCGVVDSTAGVTIDLR